MSIWGGRSGCSEVFVQGSAEEASGQERMSARAGYEAPAVVWEEALDQGAILAAACGKSDFNDIQCSTAMLS